MENFIFCAVIYVNCFNQVRFLTVVPPFGPFWSVKYLNFGQKLLIWTAHYTFLESRHPEATKNPYVLFPEGSQKRYQLMNHYHHFFEQQRRNDTLNLLTPWHHTTLLRCRSRSCFIHMIVEDLTTTTGISLRLKVSFMDTPVVSIFFFIFENLIFKIKKQNILSLFKSNFWRWFSMPYSSRRRNLSIEK